MPEELADALRIERWGAPQNGGWLDWPALWTRRMEAAANTYHGLRAYQEANATLEGESLKKWETRNPDIVDLILRIELTRVELEETQTHGR